MTDKIQRVEITQKHNMVAWLLPGGLLFFLIALLGIIGCFTKSVWVDVSFQTGTYLLTAILLGYPLSMQIDKSQVTQRPEFFSSINIHIPFGWLFLLARL